MCCCDQSCAGRIRGSRWIYHYARSTTGKTPRRPRTPESKQQSLECIPCTVTWVVHHLPGRNKKRYLYCTVSNSLTLANYDLNRLLNLKSSRRGSAGEALRVRLCGCGSAAAGTLLPSRRIPYCNTRHGPPSPAVSAARRRHPGANPRSAISSSNDASICVRKAWVSVRSSPYRRRESGTEILFRRSCEYRAWAKATTSEW